jgi:hypothetical protein
MPVQDLPHDSLQSGSQGENRLFNALPKDLTLEAKSLKL